MQGDNERKEGQLLALKTRIGSVERELQQSRADLGSFRHV